MRYEFEWKHNEGRWFAPVDNDIRHCTTGPHWLNNTSCRGRGPFQWLVNCNQDNSSSPLERHLSIIRGHIFLNYPTSLRPLWRNQRCLSRPLTQSTHLLQSFSWLDFILFTCCRRHQPLPPTVSGWINFLTAFRPDLSLRPLIVVTMY